jgi:hypothetical protein
LKACEKNGIQIRCSFGGHHGHQHYLGHPDAEVRHQSEQWFKQCIDQTAYLGGSSFGTCFAIQTVRTHNDPVLRSRILEDAIDAYHRLAEHAANAGLNALAYEMTSVPRETCATFDENDYVLERCSDMAVPMKVCLDMGHRNLAGKPQEADHLAWIRRYGGSCDVIDCQQTDLSASRHWPFTQHFNDQGVIEPDEVIEAIEDSGASEILLAFEIKTPAYHPAEYSHLDNLRASVDYWRRWIKD